MRAMGEDRRLRREAAIWFARLRAPDGAQARADFERWRDTSAAHAAAFARVTQHWHASSALVDSKWRAASPLLRPWWRRAEGNVGRLAFGGAALAALVAGVWQIPRPAMVAPIVQMTSPLGQRRTVALPDGSQLTLDSDSAVTTEYSAGERRIRLDRGRARFVVAHDADRRFVVTSGSTSVVARGTVFDVDAIPGAVTVTLVQGAVDVLATRRSAPLQRIALVAGKQVVVPDDTAHRMALHPAPSGAGSWTTGMLSFDAAPLDQVVAQANRYRTAKLVLADPTLGGLKVTGAFRASAPDDLLHGLVRLFDLHATPQSDGTIQLVPGRGTAPPQKGG